MTATRGKGLFDRSREEDQIKQEKAFIERVKQSSDTAGAIIQASRDFITNPSQQTKDTLDRAPTFSGRDRRKSG